MTIKIKVYWDKGTSLRKTGAYDIEIFKTVGYENGEDKKVIS